MKNLYLIGGTMGVGKTTVSQLLKIKLSNSVFLDGDWCWDSDPFIVTDETKSMVLDNICCLLNNFLKCSAYENIIFCWVMHQQSTIDTIISHLNIEDCSVHTISLICDKSSLVRRLEKDITQGLRTPDVIDRSLAYLPLYELVDSIKIDVSNISPNEIVELIIRK